ncbi:hypothetical protein DPEC_G00028260 [Dallia pectoralis]|uniref:Uncharacterized protein n=1 Tax=Dallia pectoralis TaxID=75939 RepID=A0ACC2HHY5_DALPE|nr:hypothetical protein DPEC_G00028260 [Dallia pectoralis]
MLEEFPSDCWVRQAKLMEILTVMCLSLLNKRSHVPEPRHELSEHRPSSNFSIGVFQEDDVIFQRNTPGDRMFFIEHGLGLVETDSFPQELADGDYFGDRFQMALQGFPDIRRDMEKLAKQDYEDMINL